MASSMKCMYYKDPGSQLNNYSTMPVPNHEQNFRNIYNDTTTLSKLSSTLLDNVVYQRIYGLPANNGMRYSAVVADTVTPVKEVKRQSLQLEPNIAGYRDRDKGEAARKDNRDQVDPKTTDLDRNDEATQNPSISETTSSDNSGSDESSTSDSSYDTSDMSSDTSPEKSPTVRRKSDVGAFLAHTVVLQKHFSLGQETDLSNGVISEKRKKMRSNSELGLGYGGRTRRKDSSQIDITSTPLYKEIYANNLRQYGFILAKKLGISNQTPKELRATYLQSRQKAELRREKAFNSYNENNDNSQGNDNETKNNTQKPNHGRSNSFADFGRRPQQCAPRVPRANTSPTTTTENDKPSSKTTANTHPKTENEIVGNETLPECSTASTTAPTASTATIATSVTTAATRSQPITHCNATTCAPTNKQTATRMRRSNTIEFLDRWGKDRPLSTHSRSSSDLSTTKCSNSLTNISENFDPSLVRSRELRRQSCLDVPSNSPSPRNSLYSGDSSDGLDTSGTCTDESSHFDSSPVIMRRLKKVHDPHKRLSVPLLTHPENPSQSTTTFLDSTSRRSSTPDVSDKSTTDVGDDVTSSCKSVLSSLSVPNLYHQSSFGKEKLMDDYCQQDVPRHRLSVVSLRRHNEAKERLERRMLKLKSFEGVLTEADTFIKDVQSRKAAATSAKTIQEEAIPE